MNLTLIIVVIVVFAVVAIALAALKSKGGAKEDAAKPDVYYVKKSLFSPAER